MVRIANPRDGRLRIGTQERSKAGKRLGGALTTSIGLRPEWPPSNVQQFNCIDCDLLTRHRSRFRLAVLRSISRTIGNSDHTPKILMKVQDRSGIHLAWGADCLHSAEDLPASKPAELST